jgi:magnesium transporter
MVVAAAGDAVTVSSHPSTPPDGGWVWIDVRADPSDIDELTALTAGLGLDGLSLRDAVEDVDLPKVDDFGHQLVVILHGLRDDRVATYELHCFVTDRHLVTVRRCPSAAVDALWGRVGERPELAVGGIDLMVGRLSDVVTRRLLSVLEAYDDRVEGLIDRALAADDRLLEELTAVRSHIAAMRRVIYPQREVLDQLRHSTSALVSDAGRRRFSDVFDLASRTAQGLDSARTALAEILDAYRGAEARRATDVTKVLTVYAAIMLPLSLVVGFFGMNFENLPGLDSDRGWLVVSVGMFVIAAVSLGVFVSVGWVRRPSGRQAGVALGRGLIEATRAPAQVAGAVFEISTMPLRATAGRRMRSSRPDSD